MKSFPLVSFLAAMFLLAGQAVEAVARETRSKCVENLNRTRVAELDAPSRREALSGLIECLENPDAAIRDGYAFTLLSELLRSGAVETDIKLELTQAAKAKLLQADEDAQGFRGPFAALALSELARADRIAPFLSSEQRTEMIELVAGYLVGLVDYRGFDEQAGWRHGVAHSADFFMQIALNPALTKEQALLIRDAIKAKVGPEGAHFYTFGEPARLARPILILANRDIISPEDWRRWFMELGPENGARAWSGPYSSLEGLARIHNVTAFASAIAIGGSQSEQPSLKSLSANAIELLKALP